MLFLPMVDWHTRIQRSQHLAMALSACGHRCFYVNPHLGFEFASAYPCDRRHRMSLLAPRVIELHLRLPQEPVVHHRLPTERECHALEDALGELVRVANVRKLVQIVSLPFWLRVAERLRRTLEFPIIYDCHDFLSAFQGVRPELSNGEADLFQLCDLVVFSSERLMDAKTTQFPYLREKRLLVRNATAGVSMDVEALRRRDSKKSSGKVIGYIGALDDWFDVAAFREAALRRPEWEFLLVGRIESRSVRVLADLPNVRFLGEVPHSDIHEHLARFDVGLIPFVLNELTLSANPIKLYEYLGYGIPVVSSRLPEVEMLGDLVYIADNPSEFADKVEAAASEHTPLMRQRRIEVAQREMWPVRASQLQEAFTALLRPLPLDQL